ncbi:MAG: Sua5/YciO/YrdC/YwlC family protein [Firmicutes bacterium]|jgi:tRNA A37 threonylcarbamoyladenosine synthetase subunit TsaC/SUA5/YrdC|nr:Sua5/YciO/YrdC/YwlC family protein [Bacillota bacterium]
MSYYQLTFQPAVTRQPRHVPILRVDPGEETAPRRAVEVLRAGGVIVFPEEDGYYVGCLASDAAAVDRVRQLTGAAPDQLVRYATSGEDGARVPVHPVVRALLREVGGPLVAATAPAGRRPAPTAQQVVFVVGDGVDLVLDAGRILALPAAA